VDTQRWQQLEVLYRRALAQPAEARPAFLADACPADELRGEVKSRLARAADAHLATAGGAAAGAHMAATREHVYRISGTATAYEVHPDGKRFIMVSEAEGSGDAGMRQKVNVVLNWFEELARVAPSR